MSALSDLPGAPECLLPPGLEAQLPRSTPGPPWECRIRGTVWLQRGAAPVVDASAGPTLPLTVCAALEYLDSPVGGYREVFAAALLRRAGWPTVHVPFMAVDSLPSLQGGRSHWALPKSPAQFTAGDGGVTARGPGWSVSVAPRPAGPSVPLRLRLVLRQGGREARLSLRARVRPARVRVDAAGPSLTSWLGSGTHVGVVGDGRMVLGPPR